MKLYIIRHGLTEFNKAKKYQGTLDIPLSEEGVSEIEKADITPELVYVTPLMRTKQTAEHMFPSVKQVVNEDIREMNFGIFEGRNYLDMANDEQYRKWVDSDCTLPCPNGESREIFTKRVCKGIDNIITENILRNNKIAVVVAHGGTQMALLSAWGKQKKAYYEWLCNNNCGYVCEINEKTWENTKSMTVIARYDNGKEVPFN